MKTKAPAPPAAPAPDVYDQLFPLREDHEPLGEEVRLDLLELTSALVLIANTDLRRYGKYIEGALCLCVKVLDVITGRMEASERDGRAPDPNDF